MSRVPYKFQRCELCGMERQITDFRYINDKHRRDTVCLICRPMKPLGNRRKLRDWNKHDTRGDWYTVVRDAMDYGEFARGARLSVLDVRLLLAAFSLADGTVLERMGRRYVVVHGKLEVLADGCVAEA